MRTFIIRQSDVSLLKILRLTELAPNRVTCSDAIRDKARIIRQQIAEKAKENGVCADRLTQYVENNVLIRANANRFDAKVFALACEICGITSVSAGPLSKHKLGALMNLSNDENPQLVVTHSQTGVISTAPIFIDPYRDPVAIQKCGYDTHSIKIAYGMVMSTVSV